MIWNVRSINVTHGRVETRAEDVCCSIFEDVPHAWNQLTCATDISQRGIRDSKCERERVIICKEELIREVTVDIGPPNFKSRDDVASPIGNALDVRPLKQHRGIISAGYYGRYRPSRGKWLSLDSGSTATISVWSHSLCVYCSYLNERNRIVRVGKCGGRPESCHEHEARHCTNHCIICSVALSSVRQE